LRTQLLRNEESVALDVWVRLLRGHAAMRRTLSAQLHADHGLTVNDYEALLLLSRAEDGQLRRVDLADGLQLTPSGVTRMLDGLEEHGFVCKGTCESDARVTFAVVTEAGLKKLKEASCSHVGAIQGLFEERFDDAELARLADLLSRLPGAGSADAGECTAP
jgi:DNA-binding MarR family transcriptional regulator